MKQIIAVDFQITSENVDGSKEEDWDTLLSVLKQAVAIYDEADIKRQKRLQRPIIYRRSADKPKAILIKIPQKHHRK